MERHRRAAEQSDGSTAEAGGDGSPSANGSTAAKVNRLTDPQWLYSHDEQMAAFHHDAQLGMKVRGEGLEGRKVRFLVEHREGSEWLHVDTAEGVVRGRDEVGV